MQGVERRWLDIEERFREQNVRFATRGMAVGDSETTVGNEVLRLAKSDKDLVIVTDEAKADAARWLERAGPEQSAAWQRATHPESRVSEQLSGGGGGDTVQTLFSDMLRTQPSRGSQLHDVHAVTSVCRVFKPDIVISTGSACLPTNTVLLLDLKPQDGFYNCASHMYQVGCSPAAHAVLG